MGSDNYLATGALILFLYLYGGDILLGTSYYIAVLCGVDVTPNEEVHEDVYD